MGKRIVAIIMLLLFVSLPVDANAQSYPSKDKVYEMVKDNLIAHKNAFTINISTKTLKEIGTDTDLIQVVTELDDKSTSKDGDYLKINLKSWKESWKWSSSGEASITFSVEYKSSAEQEKALDAKIKSIITNLKLSKATDYRKVKAIHDYIINRVSYDQSFEKVTAYDALINKSSVCEGYAAAAYRLFTDAGLESRIIFGEAGGGAHSWNIVKVNDKWYNIDLTWDDPITASGKPVLNYNYFLKNAKAFSDHTRDAEYSSKSFLSEYPITAKSYEMRK